MKIEMLAILTLMKGFVSAVPMSIILINDILMVLNNKFILHSFIYFSFHQSIQGHRQPIGYRTCHTVNAI